MRAGGKGEDEVVEAVEEEENIEVLRNIRTEDSEYDGYEVSNISLETLRWITLILLNKTVTRRKNI